MLQVSALDSNEREQVGQIRVEARDADIGSRIRRLERGRQGKRRPRWCDRRSYARCAAV